MQWLSFAAVLGTGGMMLLFAMLSSPHKLLQLLRRARWLMLTLLLIYAYSTPGQPLLSALGVISPSREGLLDGMLQLTRLLAALAGLAILLSRLHRSHLIAGLYTLFAPMQWLGMSRERLAVRLALTLQYGEAALLRETCTWQDHLHGLSEPQGQPGKSMELPRYRVSIGDALLLGCALLLLFGALR
jgi:energy-coupling factor transport system permease protein